ncbi:hypothetical protein PCI56_03250 [Plesiomonas shigelloides subsp. oncorhynchi]|nr:hypothetical protein [Plesiomonas shigelloides]
MLRTIFSSPVSVTETVLARATHATHATQDKPHPVATFTLEHLSGLPAADFSTPERLLIWADDGDFVLEVNQQKILCHVGDALLLNSGRHCRLLPYHAPLTPNMHSLGLSAEWIGSFNLNYNALAQRQRHARLHAAGCQDVQLTQLVATAGAGVRLRSIARPRAELGSLYRRAYRRTYY